MTENLTLYNYNVTSILNTSDGENMFVKLVRFVSNPNPSTTSVFDYMPGILIIFTLFMIIWFSMKSKGFTNAVCAFSSSLIVFITALFFYPLGVLSGLILVWCAFLLLFSIGWIWLSN